MMVLIVRPEPAAFLVVVAVRQAWARTGHGKCAEDPWRRLVRRIDHDRWVRRGLEALLRRLGVGNEKGRAPDRDHAVDPTRVGEAPEVDLRDKPDGTRVGNIQDQRTTQPPAGV